MANDSLEQLALHTIGGGWGAEIEDATNNIRVSVIRGTDIPRLRIGDCSSVPVRYESSAKVKNRLLRPGDIVIEVSGGSAATGQHTGRALLISEAIIDSLGGNVIPASFCRLLRLDAERVNPSFIAYQIDGLHLTGEIAEFENQSTGISNFQFSRFVQETFPCIDDFQSQTIIAHILGTLDDKIALNRTQNETLEAMARALFKAWFVDFEPVRAKLEGRARQDGARSGQPRTPQASDLPWPEAEAGAGAKGWQRGQSLPGLPAHLYDLFPDRLVESELGEIPEGWEVTSLSEFASLNPESWTKRTRPEQIQYVDLSNTKWGRVESVTNYEANNAPSRAQRVLRPLDAIVGTVRPGNGSYALIFDVGLTGSTGFAVLRPLRREYSEFVYLAVTARENIERLSNLADGGAYPAVRPEIVSATQVPRADQELINEFSQQVSPMISGIADNDRTSRTLAQLRDTLLPKLISGELRVPDAEAFLKERVS